MSGWIKKLILVSKLEKLLKELLMGRLTSRKFWLVVGVLAAAYALVWKGILDVGPWMEWAKWVLTAYLGANVAESVAEKITKPK